MNLLITGGAGFIGSHFVLRWVAAHPADTVVVLDKLTYAGRKEYLTPVLRQIVFVEGDIANPELVSDLCVKYGIDAIVNFAAESHVDNSINDAWPFLHTNVLGVQNLIDVCRARPQILLLHISTDEVYGEVLPGEPPRVPESPLKPGNPYAASKAAGDLLVLAAARTHGIRARITRCTNNFGPHQASEKFLPTIIRSARANVPVPLYGDGKQRRDWLYVTDHTDAIALVLEKGKDGQIYHISADDERENIAVAQEMMKLLKASPTLITSVPDRPGHDFRYALDSSSVRGLGWQPRVRFLDGLTATIAWYLDHTAS